MPETQKRIVFFVSGTKRSMYWHGQPRTIFPKVRDPVSYTNLLPSALSVEEVGSFAIQVDTRLGKDTGNVLGPWALRTKAVYRLGKMSTAGGDRETFFSVLGYLSEEGIIGIPLTYLLKRYDRKINSS